MSDFAENGSPLSISGSTYPGEPHFYNSYFELSREQAKPKSAIHTCKSLLSIISILSGLISRCTVLFLCIRSSAKRSYSIIIRISPSFTLPFNI